MFSFKWPDNLTTRFLHERITNRNKFPIGQRNNLAQYQKLVQKLNIQISPRQAQSKWQNLIYKYKELKKLQQENVIVAKENWSHFNQLDAFFEGRYEIDPMFHTWSSTEIENCYTPDDKNFIKGTNDAFTSAAVTTTTATESAVASLNNYDFSQSGLLSSENVLISKRSSDILNDDTNLLDNSKRLKEDDLMYILPSNALHSVDNNYQVNGTALTLPVGINNDEDVFAKFINNELNRIRDIRIRENAKWEIQCAIRKAITEDLDKLDECSDSIEN